jgi:hypothetical protein
VTPGLPLPYPARPQQTRRSQPGSPPPPSSVSPHGVRHAASWRVPGVTRRERLSGQSQPARPPHTLSSGSLVGHQPGTRLEGTSASGWPEVPRQQQLGSSCEPPRPPVPALRPPAPGIGPNSSWICRGRQRAVWKVGNSRHRRHAGRDEAPSPPAPAAA